MYVCISSTLDYLFVTDCIRVIDAKVVSSIPLSRSCSSLFTCTSSCDCIYCCSRDSGGRGDATCEGPTLEPNADQSDVVTVSFDYEGSRASAVVHQVTEAKATATATTVAGVHDDDDDDDDDDVVETVIEAAKPWRNDWQDQLHNAGPQPSSFWPSDHFLLAAQLQIYPHVPR